MKRFPLSLRRLFWVGVGSRVRFARASVRRPLRVRRAGGAAPDPAGSGCFCSGFCSCSNEEFFRKREALEEILRSESPEHSGALLIFGADNC